MKTRGGLIDPEVKQGPYPDTCILGDPHCECRKGQRCTRLPDRPKGAAAELHIIDLLHVIEQRDEDVQTWRRRALDAEDRLRALAPKLRTPAPERDPEGEA